VKQVPYAAIRVLAGAIATAWCLYQFLNAGSALGLAFGLAAFIAGWIVARRFGRPVGMSNERPWLDTVLPIAIAAFAIAPAMAYPFVGQISIAVTTAVFVLFFAGMSLSLGAGPYANEKVALSLKMGSRS
jgi:hypothetical protein